MKSIGELKWKIEEAAPQCPECGEFFDEWMDADSNEKIFYVAPDALFTGICSKGHLIELYLSELNAGEIIPHMRTERTLGRPVKQSECSHSRKLNGELQEGQTSVSPDGLLTGPRKITFCVWCGVKQKAPDDPPKKDRSRLILPPGV